MVEIDKIPISVAPGPFTADGTPVDQYLAAYGWKRSEKRGKVRDGFRHRARPGTLLQIASDRLSIRDFVLPGYVPRKGEVLTAFDHFWTDFLSQTLTGYKHDRLDMANLGDLFGPNPPLEILKWVQEHEVQKTEFILRSRLGGSVYGDYLKTGVVAGTQLPPGLPLWSRLGVTLFTPSTKEEEGHDVNYTAQGYFDAVGDVGHTTVTNFRAAFELVRGHAYQRGLEYFDTKTEYATDGRVNVDERYTPDSSRIARTSEIAPALARNEQPPFYDKEFVRLWGNLVTTPSGKVGIQTLDPRNPDDLRFVHGLTLPEDVIQETSRRYLELFGMMTGYELAEYQVKYMGVRRAKAA